MEILPLPTENSCLNILLLEKKCKERILKCFTRSPPQILSAKDECTSFFKFSNYWLV